MEGFRRSGPNVVFTGMALVAFLPALLVTAAPPRLAGLSSQKDERYPQHQPHVNSVYSNSPFLSSSEEKPFHLQKSSEETVPSPNFPGVAGIESSGPYDQVEYRGYQPPGIYRPPHQEQQSYQHQPQNVQIPEEVNIPRLPAFSPELDRARTEGPLGPLSLLDQLAPNLW